MAISIGSQLRAGRERKQQSVSAVAAAIRSKAQIIEAIERDDFSVFTAPIYSKGFIRLYAQYVGLDPRPLVEAYRVASAPQKTEAPPSTAHVPPMTRLLPDGAPVPSAALAEEIRAPDSSDLFNEVPERTRPAVVPEHAPLLKSESDPGVAATTSKWGPTRAPPELAPWRQRCGAARDLAREVWVTWRLTLRERMAEMRAEKDPWKVVPLTIGLVVLLVFIASALTRCARRPSADIVLVEPTVEEPLKLAADVPEPYFE